MGRTKKKKDARLLGNDPAPNQPPELRASNQVHTAPVLHHKPKSEKRDLIICSKKAIIYWTIFVIIVASYLTKKTVDPDDKLIEALLDNEVINNIAPPSQERPGLHLKKYLVIFSEDIGKE